MNGFVHAAEFVLPGHPDKLADAVADALVEAAWRHEPRSLVGVEVAVHRATVMVTGHLRGPEPGAIDVEAIVRDVYRSAGYGEWAPVPEELQVVVDLDTTPLDPGESEARTISDDHAICVGYANDLVATGHVPVEHWLARRLARRLCALRGDRPELVLGPDGKLLVEVREHGDGDGRAWRLEAFGCAVQQCTKGDGVMLHRAVRELVHDELRRCAADLPGLSSVAPESVTVNGAGAFAVGGPFVDNGLSGKKLVVDAYGPRVPIGGGAWSGKDFAKADRAGALHARRVAKAIVRLGLAREAKVVLSWRPGDRAAHVVQAVADGGRALDPARWEGAFDLGLERSVRTFATEGLVEMARWGWFGDETRAWERVEGW